MAKIVRVAGAASVEPQEVPGYPLPFPVTLSDSGKTEAEWRDDENFKRGVFEIVDSRTKAGTTAAKAADAVPDPADNSETVDAGASGEGGES